jgi:hypothetical protein
MEVAAEATNQSNSIAEEEGYYDIPISELLQNLGLKRIWRENDFLKIKYVNNKKEQYYYYQRKVKR